MVRAVKHMTHVRAIARVKKTSVSQKPARRGMPRRAGVKIFLLGSVNPVARIAPKPPCGWPGLARATKKRAVSHTPARRGWPPRAGDKICLLGSVQPVARIAETRQDIAVLVEVAVAGGDEHIHVWVFPGEAPDALRCGDDRHELDLFDAVAL